MAVEVLQNEEVFGGEWRRKSRFCYPSKKNEWGGGIKLRKESEELLSETLLLHSQSRGEAKKEGSRKFR